MDSGCPTAPTLVGLVDVDIRHDRNMLVIAVRLWDMRWGDARIFQQDGRTHRPMTVTEVIALSGLFFLAAILYSSVGHAGASGYLAVMALVGVAPAMMKPTALTLNILVATLGTIRFYRAGVFSWSNFWPFVVGSIPLAFVGGAVHLPGAVYRPIVGIILLVAALWMLRPATKHNTRFSGRVPVIPAMLSGGGIGLLSGLTGTGGGIFLSPLMLFAGWTEPRQTAGVSAAFILVNSLSGLAGNVASVGGPCRRPSQSGLPLHCLAASSAQNSAAAGLEAMSCSICSPLCC